MTQDIDPRKLLGEALGANLAAGQTRGQVVVDGREVAAHDLALVRRQVVCHRVRDRGIVIPIRRADCRGGLGQTFQEIRQLRQLATVRVRLGVFEPLFECHRE